MKSKFIHFVFFLLPLFSGGQTLEMTLPNFIIRDPKLYDFLRGALEKTVKTTDADSLIFPVLTISNRNPCYTNLKIAGCPTDTIFYQLKRQKVSMSLYYLNVAIGYALVGDVGVILVLYDSGGFSGHASQTKIDFVRPTNEEIVQYKALNTYCWDFYKYKGVFFGK